MATTTDTHYFPPRPADAPRRPGRLFFANPGPTNIPDSVLRAIDRPSEDFADPNFLAVFQYAKAGLRRLLGTTGRVFFYTASGHGSWEATIVNLFSPGDQVLVVETGYFSNAWAEIAQAFGLEVIGVPADWRRGAEVSHIVDALRADTAHRIRAVLCVHNETATGIVSPLREVRAAIDAAAHPAMLLTDTISSLGSIDFHMDAWGVDAVVGGSQKGLMLPTGVAFTAVSDRAWEAHLASKASKYYFNWSNMTGRAHESFVGTVPTQVFYGMAESIRLIEQEGYDALIARHARLATAVRAAVRVWSGNHGPELFCQTPARVSNSVTAILAPEGFSADAIRAAAMDFNVSLGGGLGPLGGKVFRIGHLGDLNEPMILGTLGVVELALAKSGTPHGRGGVQAALESLAA